MFNIITTTFHFRTSEHRYTRGSEGCMHLFLESILKDFRGNEFLD